MRMQSLKESKASFFRIGLLAVLAATMLLGGCSSSTPNPTTTPGAPDPAVHGLRLPMQLAALESMEMKQENATYRNNIPVPDEWPDYGIGDPSILKYDGIFYLYASTPYQKIGVRCWTSTDLVHWTARGSITDEPATFTAYSPKVIYWNGLFYLYTTPNGDGLHILVSDRPTGPFKDITGKIHQSIDASIFIDDDGKWYMTHGNAGQGVEVHEMPTPLTVDAAPHYIGAVVDGGFGNAWTETGQFIKRGDDYFITFSGNHVCNDAYRTLWGVTDSPLAPIRKGDRALLLSTQGPLVGTACGLVFTGPDLLSDYIIYHNLVNPFVGPVREMDIDRIAFNGKWMVSFGPTAYDQDVPRLPDFEDRFPSLGDDWTVTGDVDAKDGIVSMGSSSRIVSRQTTEKEYAAEFNLHPDSGIAALCSYKDENDYLAVELSSKGEVRLVLLEKGQPEVLSEGSMQKDYDASVLHTIRIVKAGRRIDVFIDSMRKLSCEDPGIEGGAIGYLSTGHGSAGYAAFTNGTTERILQDAYKPISGQVQAIQSIGPDPDLGVQEPSIVDGPQGGKAVALDKGFWQAYRIRSGESGSHTVEIEYRAKEAVRIAAMDSKGDVLAWVDAPATGDAWQTCILRDASLPSGRSILVVGVLEGSCEMYQLGFRSTVGARTEEYRLPASVDTADGWTHLDGTWNMEGASLSLDSLEGFGTLVGGDLCGSDYVMEGSVVLDPHNFGSAGFLVRVQNAAAGMEYAQNNPYNHQAYFAYLTTSGEVGIEKHDFANKILAQGSFPYEEGKTYHLAVAVIGTEIRVSVDGIEVVRFDDRSAPFTTGRVGLHGLYASATFSDIIMKPA